MNRDLTPKEFEVYGTRLIKDLADFFAGIEQLRVLPDCSPGDFTSLVDLKLPIEGDSLENILEDTFNKVIPYTTHWNHPGFMAYFNSTASFPGIFAELVTASLSVNGMLWKSSPAASELEKITLDWLTELLGLPRIFFGIIYDTASTSTFHALAAAREKLGVYDFRNEGIGGEGCPRLSVYMSEHAHSSVDKAAIIIGAGTKGIRKIKSNAKYEMIPEKLEAAISADKALGITPLAVIATIGTTSTTSVDPLLQIAEICRRENIWLHVDAAHSGVTAMLPEKKSIFEGIEFADSLVVNPHKWLFVPMDLSVLFVRDKDNLKKTFSLIPEYLKTGTDSVTDNLMDYGIPLGRRFRSLKLWFVIRYFGKAGLSEILRKHIGMAGEFVRLIESANNFEVMAPVPFSTVCFRYVKSGRDDSTLNMLNQKLLELINSSGRIFLSHTVLNGKFVIRIVFSGIKMEIQHVNTAFNIITEQVKKLEDNK